MSLRIDVYPVTTNFENALAGCWHVYCRERSTPLIYEPNGHQEIYFDLTTRTSQININWTNPFIQQNKPEVNILILRFAPFALSLFNNQKKNLSFPIRDNRVSKQLERIVFSKESVHQKFEIIQELVIESFGMVKRPHSVIDQTISAINNSKGTIKLTSFYESLDLSSRQVENIFLRTTGLSPKSYSRIIRLQEAFKEKSQNPHKSFSEITYEYEYFDQAHFIHDCRNLTSLTPAEYLRRLESNSIHFID
jgi:AraC-like DNA-binding protein